MIRRAATLSLCAAALGLRNCASAKYRVRDISREKSRHFNACIGAILVTAMLRFNRHQVCLFDARGRLIEEGSITREMICGSSLVVEAPGFAPYLFSRTCDLRHAIRSRSIHPDDGRVISAPLLREAD